MTTRSLTLVAALSAAVLADAAEISAFHPTVEAALAQAHAVLVERFLPADGLLLDYVGELPTPKDCAEGRPNAIGWWSPIENGPMFTGPYLAAMCEKAEETRSQPPGTLPAPGEAALCSKSERCSVTVVRKIVKLQTGGHLRQLRRFCYTTDCNGDIIHNGEHRDQGPGCGAGLC